jgi:signal transduction histidine kinase
MSHSERIHLAQELHDGIAQDLVGLGYSLDILLSTPETPNATRAELRGLRFTITDLLEKVRSEIHQLHIGDGVNLSSRIARSADELCENIALELVLDDVPLDPDGEVAYQIHQIAREFIRNAAKHSGATLIRFRLSVSGNAILLSIADNGVGGMAQAPNRFGLVGARSRAASIGGALTLDSSENGTHVELCIPIPEERTS